MARLGLSSEGPRVGRVPRVLAVVLATITPATFPAAQGRVEGSLEFRWPDRPAPTLYRYVIAPDSSGGAVTIYEGPEPGASSFTLPPTVLSILSHRVERRSPSPGDVPPAFAEVAREGGGLLVAFERRLSLALLGLGGALAAVLVLGLTIRRERRGRAVLVEARRREVESREAERLQLARELHDGPVQLLHLARLNLSTPEGATGTDAREEVAEAVRELRAIAEGLRPPALGPFGLAPALEDLATRFREQYPAIDVVLRLDDDGGRIGEEARLALFRIAQEALANSGAHASPTRVEVRFSAGPRNVELTVEDDGRGGASADARALGRRGHFGMLGMRERAELLGGTLDVDSAPGRGTRIHLRAPWAKLAGTSDGNTTVSA